MNETILDNRLAQARYYSILERCESVHLMRLNRHIANAHGRLITQLKVVSLCSIIILFLCQPALRMRGSHITMSGQ